MSARIIITIINMQTIMSLNTITPTVPIVLATRTIVAINNNKIIAKIVISNIFRVPPSIIWCENIAQKGKAHEG